MSAERPGPARPPVVAASGDAPGAGGILVDAAARRRAVEDLDANLLIEAAAGSGKTTLLLERIVHLVRTGRARLAEIAAVTFTEKAAADLKIRLRAALERAGLDDALRELEIARIGTIHQFAATLLRERPVEAGVDPGFVVADAIRARLLLESTWERWLTDVLGGAECDAAPVRRAVELGVSLEALRGLAFALADERDQLGRLPEPVDPPEPLDLLGASVREAIQRLEGHVREFAKDADDRAARAVLQLAAWVRQTAELPAATRVDALLEDARFPDGVDRLGAKTRWRSPARLDECRAVLGDLAARVGAARLAVRHNLAVALARWSVGFVEAYQRAKIENGFLDFQDLLILARDLVRDRPDVRGDLQRQIRCLLVDEFQDTDPLQLEMLVTLAEGAPPGCLFIVGDPKQSIYRFRRADIETYEAAKARIAATGGHLEIRVNFRSDRRLLEAVNQVFEGVMASPPDGAYQPEYVPLEPSPQSRPGSAPIALRVAGELAPPETAEEALVLEARLLAGYLRREVEDAGRLRYGDVVLLFRAMTGVAAYEDAFREAGIPFRTVAARHYYARSEVGWTIAALRAVDDPHDPVALVGALRSPFFGVPDDAFFWLREHGGVFSYLAELPAGAPPSLGAAWTLLRELHGMRNAVAPPALVERLYTRTEVLAAYALDQQGEARVANLLKVLDTARALEATGVLTFRALVRWLAEQGGARYEEEESVVEGEDVVRLMTIHKAKGLEFPVVIVPDLCREGSLRPGPLLVDRTAGRLEINLGRVGDSPLSTVGWDAALVREQSRSDAEALRLLYVSLTRAQRVLILPVPVRVDSAGFFGYLGPLLEGWDTVALEVATGTGRDAPGVAAAPQETLAAWRAERDALIARGRAGSAAVVRPSASAAPPRNRAGKGQLRGRLVHAALATLDLAGPPDVAPDVAEVVAALGAGLGASPDVVRSAAHLVRRAVALPVWQRARRATWVAREVAVTAELDGTLVDGRIDLAFEEEGGLVVVEFKTAEAPAGTEEQTALYADALARVLARPVREVVVVRLLA